MGRLLTAVVVVVVFLAAGCGGSDDPDSASEQTTTTTERATTTTTVIGIERDTEIAVRDCIDKMQGIGLSYAIDDEAAVDAAEEACDEAMVLLDVDSQGVVGNTVPNQIRVEISDRRVEVAELGLTASVRGVSMVEAGELDSTWVTWATEIEQILDAGI